MKRVVILQHRLLHYRLRLFSMLRTACSDAGIEMTLIHGQPSDRELSKNDVGKLPFAEVVRNRFLAAGRIDLMWQPLPKKFRDVDLIIVMQESRIISNYLLLAKLVAKQSKIAYWGHGANLQSGAPNGVRELWKRSLINQVDWWFAYTELTKEILLDAGFPSTHITCLNNAIDNEGFSADLDSAEPFNSAASFNLGDKTPSKLAIFCGSLYPEKRLEVLIKAADMIKAKIPEFGLVILGDGPSHSYIKNACAERSWVLAAGAKRGKEKAAYFKAASLVLNPGAVGLHVLDAFAAGLPMVTMADSKHGPEIAYLQDGVNGIISNGGATDYATRAIDLLTNEALMRELRANALAKSKELTLANMVNNFVSGISSCLSARAKPTQLKDNAT